MEMRQLGRTGVSVSPLCLGAMMFGAIGNTDHDDSIRIIHRALDAGINFIDTADVYSQGESEEIVGKALKGRRDEQEEAQAPAATVGPRQEGQLPHPRWQQRRHRARHRLVRRGPLRRHVDARQPGQRVGV